MMSFRKKAQTHNDSVNAVAGGVSVVLIYTMPLNCYTNLTQRISKYFCVLLQQFLVKKN